MLQLLEVPVHRRLVLVEGGLLHSKTQRVPGHVFKASTSLGDKPIQFAELKIRAGHRLGKLRLGVSLVGKHLGQDVAGLLLQVLDHRARLRTEVLRAAVKHSAHRLHAPVGLLEAASQEVDERARRLSERGELRWRAGGERVVELHAGKCSPRTRGRRRPRRHHCSGQLR